MEKILEILKKYGYTVGIVLVALILAILVIGFNACGKKDEPEESSKTQTEYYCEIPEFSKNPDNTDSPENGGYTAFYYSDVSGEQVTEYIALLEKELKIKFNSNVYPKTAIYGEKIIAIHYNVTEKRLSVTIAEKEYNESNNNIGE